MNNWKVVKRFRKSGQTVYEVSNGTDVVVVWGYKNLIKFMGGNV